jgi:hypothetical protein
VLRVVRWLWIAALIACLATSAGAATITEWDIAGSNGNTALVLSSAADTSATDLVPVNVTPWPGGFCCFTAASGWSLAFDPTRYFEFTVSADPTHSIIYDSITLSLFRGVQGANHGAESWDLRASHDGFGSTLASFSLLGSAADEQILFANTDISALGEQFGTVTFRLYGYDYTSPSDYSGLGNHAGPFPLSGTGSNLVVEGVVTPEPSTIILVAVGLTILAVIGRQRTAG